MQANYSTVNDQLLPVPFYDDTLVLVNHNDEPFVAMKPIVTNMGLDWKTQHEKLTAKFGPVVGIIPTTGEDGKQYEMLCLPLRKFPAWLYSINPNKLAPHLRDKVVRYQDECDDVLWQYWTQGYVGQPGSGTNTSQYISLNRLVLTLVRTLKGETEPSLRALFHTQLVKTCQRLGITAPTLAELGAMAGAGNSQLDLPGV